MTAYVGPATERNTGVFVVCTVSTVLRSVAEPTGQSGASASCVHPNQAAGLISIPTPAFTRRRTGPLQVGYAGPHLHTRFLPPPVWAGRPPAACLGGADIRGTAFLIPFLSKAVAVTVLPGLGGIHDGRDAY